MATNQGVAIIRGNSHEAGLDGGAAGAPRRVCYRFSGRAPGHGPGRHSRFHPTLRCRAGEVERRRVQGGRGEACLGDSALRSAPGGRPEVVRGRGAEWFVHVRDTQPPRHSARAGRTSGGGTTGGGGGVDARLSALVRAHRQARRLSPPADGEPHRQRGRPFRPGPGPCQGRRARRDAGGVQGHGRPPRHGGGGSLDLDHVHAPHLRFPT